MSTSAKAAPSKSSKVLVFSTRGIGSRGRHLMEDLRVLMPHSRREQKLDAKERLDTANEVAELHSCTACVLFEARKRQDLYLWLSLTPGGPSVKFEVHNVHTTAELRLLGNALRGTRPVLAFDDAFDGAPHLQLMKELLTQVFSVPRAHKRSKPFVDRVMAFCVANGRVWVRNYQIVADRLEQPHEQGGGGAARAAGGGGEASGEAAEAGLVEMGPRFVLSPIRIFAGSFGGAVLYENPDYINPNELRRAARRQRNTYGSGSAREARVQKRASRAAQLERASANAPRDELADVFADDKS